MKEDLEAFCSASSWEEVLLSGENLTDSDRLTEYLMLSLRLREGIDLNRVAQLSDEVFSRRVAERMTLWSRHGLCRKTEQGFALTPEGFFVSNEMIAELI
jgi:coproporphyrinogen III oxidase-like Fe-S oxidoreductase